MYVIKENSCLVLLFHSRIELALSSHIPSSVALKTYNV